MKQVKRMAVLLFAAAMILTMTACGPKLTLEQKIEKTMSSVSDSKNMDADIQMDLSMSMLGMNMDINMNGNMVTFNDPMKMKMDLNISAMGEEIPMKMYAEAVGDGVMTYVFDGEEWIAEEVDLSDFNVQYGSMGSSPDVFLKAMKDFTQAEGSEVINGVKTVKVQGTISGEDMNKAFAASGMSGMLGGELGMDLDDDDLAEMTKDLGGMDITLWLDEVKLVPVKVEMDMTEMTNNLMAKTMGELGELGDLEDLGMSLNVSVSKCVVSITYNKLGDAADFTIPQEAKDAA